MYNLLPNGQNVPKYVSGQILAYFDYYFDCTPNDSILMADGQERGLSARKRIFPYSQFWLSYYTINNVPIFLPSSIRLLW